ncbi:MAG TPA: LysM domain-containing protein [Solirubrobacterales bacterium]
MEKRTTARARVLALTALISSFLVLIVVIASSLDGDSGPSVSNHRTPAGEVTTTGAGGGEVAAAYVVQNGDTLTSIAHKTGVSVARIQELNPDVDPQILISGEKLKLR